MKYITDLNHVSALTHIKWGIKRLLRPVFLLVYIPWLKYETWLYNWQAENRPPLEKTGEKKNLYFTAASSRHKHLVAKAIERLGHNDFDYIIVVWDGSRFDDAIFNKCRVIYEPGITFKFIKKYLTPELCSRYEYLFLWDDDIDILDFNYKNFLNIFERNHLQMAQPSLTPDSYYTFTLTLKDPDQKVGRYTDFVEVMVPVIRADCWPPYWKMIREDFSHWGLGYDSYARSVCGFKNLGIIDAESVAHTKPLVGENPERRGDYERLKHQFKGYMIAKIISYGTLQ